MLLRRRKRRHSLIPAWPIVSLADVVVFWACRLPASRRGSFQSSTSHPSRVLSSFSVFSFFFGFTSFETVVPPSLPSITLRSSKGLNLMSSGTVTLRKENFRGAPSGAEFSSFRLILLFTDACLLGWPPEPNASSAYPLLKTAPHCLLAVGIPCLARASSNLLVLLSIAVRAPENGERARGGVASRLVVEWS
jgi:hypothetical protein